MTRLLPALAILAACDPGNDGFRPGDGPGDDTGPEPLSAEVAFRVDDHPYDLAVDATGRLLVTSQGGGQLDAWDPATGELSHEARGVSGLLAIAVDGAGTLWATTSDSGVVGSVGQLVGDDVDPLATQADDGTLFRRPVDLAIAPDGALWLADRGAGGLFRVDPETGATRFVPVGVDSLRALAFQGEVLHAGAADGCWRVDPDSGAVVATDGREAHGLVVLDGEVYGANGADKVFRLGGPTVGAAELVQPGPLVPLGDHLYLSDLQGDDVWRMPLP